MIPAGWLLATRARGARAMHLRRTSRADLALLGYWDANPHVVAATGEDGAFDWEGELGRNPDWREMREP